MTREQAIDASVRHVSTSWCLEDVRNYQEDGLERWAERNAAVIRFEFARLTEAGLIDEAR